MGEGKITFNTYCGKVEVEATDELMTPFGGLVPWSAFVKKSRIFERLAKRSPVLRVSPNAAPVYDVITSFSLNALCDGSRFSHVERLRYEPTLAKLMGMRSVVSDDTIRRFLKSIPEDEGRKWLASAARPLWSSLPESFILDWDSTVITRYGRQEGAEVGYNPHKRGRASHHPLLAVAAGTRLCPYYHWRAGDSHTAKEWIQAMEECQVNLGSRRPWLNRGDAGFATESIMAWHEMSGRRPHYLFKLRLTARVREAMLSIPEGEWSGNPGAGMLQTAEKWVRLSGWSERRRVVFTRCLQGVTPAAKAGTLWDVVRREYDAYVTNLYPSECDSWQVVSLYRPRADAENVFDELKRHWGFCGFCSRSRKVVEFSALLLLLTYNLWNLFMRLINPESHVEAFQGRRWFLLIAARLVTSGHQRVVKLSLRDEWLRTLIRGYKRVCLWLAETAPQLDFAGLAKLAETVKITPVASQR